MKDQTKEGPQVSENKDQEENNNKEQEDKQEYKREDKHRQAYELVHPKHKQMRSLNDGDGRE